MSINRCTLVGRLTRTPEAKSTPNGVAVTTFTLAVDRDFKGKDGEKETDFIPIVTWRGLAENCAKFLDKGRLCAVDGRLQIRTYEANDGGKRTIAEIVADNVQFLSPKNEVSEAKPAPRQQCEEAEPLDDIPF